MATDSRQPAFRNPGEVYRQIFGAHGRRRYESGAGPFNGGCALIQCSDAFEAECAAGFPASDVHGPGAVWAWFVGSPRAFTFGFVGSAGWAARKMRANLRAEYEAVTGRRLGAIDS